MADRILPFPSGNRAMAFAPTTAFPIDARTYFESYDEALSAAKEAQEVGSKDTVYHYGMKLLVNDNGVHTWYKIADDNTLVAEGSGGSSSPIDLSNYQTKEDSSLATTDKTVVGAINELNKKAIDVYCLAEQYGSYDNTGYINNDYQSGVYWEDTLVLSAETNADEDVKLRTINYIPIIEGENVSFEVDAVKRAVKINAGTSGDDSSSSMPTIRFCGARFANDTQGPTQIVNYDYPLTLTVEIIGGQLQVDDQLQVCERRTYWYKNVSEDGVVLSEYKKQKLRRQAWYTITEEDIGQRFISIKIPNENSKIKLHHSGTMNRYDPSQSPLYLRIRRPKGNLQDNESGMTVDAEFSNIVTVWKRYSMSLGTYNIK